MAVEKGFIEYEFTQRGAEQVSRTIQKIDKETEDLTKSFIEYEKQVRGVSNTEKEMVKNTQQVGTAASGAAVSQDKLAGSTKNTRDQMLSGRYALYDLATTYTAIGVALAGVGVYATTMGAQYQSAFTNVERTLNPAEAAAVGIDNIRESLIGLTGEIPLAFSEITKIATLGNQLGIAANDIESFTDTVAKFSSATGISVEETALAFGQLGNLLGVSSEYYVNMASAIALVGVNSAATEEQIIAIAREIAPAARAAGLAADEVIGLSGALGSIRVPPERSRSTILQFFETLNMAAANGGQKFEDFATVVGVSVEKLDSMVRGGEGAGILDNFLGTLSTADTIEITQALDALGLAGLRTNPTMRALADNMGLLDQTMSDAREGFIRGSELNRQYAKTLDDLNSQWVIFINGLNALVATITGGAVESLAGLLMGVNKLVFGFRQWLIDNPWAAKIIAIGGAMITVIGVMALMRGASFALRGSMLAYLFVAQQTGVANMGLVGTLRAVTGSLATVDGAARRASVGLRIFRGAMAATGIGLAIAGIGFLGEKLLGLGGEAEDASIDYEKFLASTRASESAMSDASSGAGGLADSLGGGGSGGSPSVAAAAKEAAEQVRLLTDYATDLSGVLSRSIELRFSSQSAMDNITLKWIDLNEEMQKYQQTIRSLTADRSLKAYWLSIAEAYDDQLRAGQLREELAKIDDDLAEANAGVSTELKGNSRAAIENRKTMTGLVGEYESYISALAKSGASQQFIQDEIKRLNRDFRDQASALGFNSSEVDKYAASFTDFNTIVAQVPRDITLGFNADPAQQALNEFFAKAKQDAAAAGSDAGGAMADGLGSGMGDIGGIGSFDDLFGSPEFIEGARATGRQGGAGLGEQMLNQIKNFGEDSLKFIADTLVIIDKFFGAFNPWAESEATREASIRDAFGRAGYLGSQAFDSEFESGSETSQKIINGITYEWDAVSDTFSRLGAVSLDSFNGNFENGPQAGQIISDGILYAQDPISRDFFDTGRDASGQFRKSVADNLKLGYTLQEAINGSKAPVNNSAASVGRDGGRQFQQKMLENASASGLAGKISSESSNINREARNAGSSAGSAFGNAMRGGLSWALDLVMGSNSDGRKILRAAGFSGGGYTGAGHWQAPAGVVHRGEYVIPKKHVDQRTKLPDLGYVQSLRGGKSAPKASYATGGFVGGSMGGNGPVDLSARTVQQLSRAMQTTLLLDKRVLGEATSESYRQDNLVGAN